MTEQTSEPAKMTCSRCHRPAKHRGVYKDRPSAQFGQERLFCGLHSTLRMASEGWSFTALTAEATGV